MDALRRAAYWGTAPLVCLALYWQGLLSWFQQDDFAWLGLHLTIHNWHDFWVSLFAPMAQGTIRPLSERIFFMGFYQLFGMHALPYHAWVFLTQFATLTLLTMVTRRLTGSALAGFAAPLLWVANASLVTSLAWTSAYNEILCSFFLLLAFYFFLRYTEAGERRWYRRTWIAFLLGFGALELNVVFPALAALYALCCARRYWRATVPFFLVSVVYAGVHRLVAPAQESDIYRMYFDREIQATFTNYWAWALGTAEWERYHFHLRQYDTWGFVVLSVSLLGFSAWCLYRRQWLIVFLLGWYAIVLAPMLPLKNHLSDYYLTIPTIGLAMVAGWAVARAVRAGWLWRVLAVWAIVLYVQASVPTISDITARYYRQSHQTQMLVESLAYAHQLYPQKTILLKGVDRELFWMGVFDHPCRIFGLNNLFLTPETPSDDFLGRGSPLMAHYQLSSGPVVKALEQERAVVYEVGPVRLRNVTSRYEAEVVPTLKPGLSRHVDIGQDLYREQVGRGWYALENGYRWMSQRGEVTVGGPRSSQDKLYVQGSVTAAQVAAGPVWLTVTIDGRAFPARKVDRANSTFEFAFELAPDQLGKEAMQVTLAVDRTFRPGSDTRDLGAVFGSVDVR